MKEDLWQQTDQEPVELKLKSRAWNWIGHTLRKPDGNIAKTALELNPQGRRKRGRPAQTWRHSQLAELQAKGVTWAAAKKKVQNRIRWKSGFGLIFCLEIRSRKKKNYDHNNFFINHDQKLIT